ncbi:MAG: hypothetical protein KBD12_00870 [Candidatus Pacebacteria bacterium]|nr:hypothetical protein [Candidatus Paceibacterota bacterium]
MKKTFKNIFKICIYLFAVWGFVLTVVFFAMKLGLTKSNSLIDSQSDYFKKLTIDSKNGDDERSVVAQKDWIKIRYMPEWQVIKVGLTNESSIINKVSQETGINPRLLITPLIAEQLRLMTSERETFKKYFAPLGVLGNQTQFSLGIFGIKENTAKEIEMNLKDPSSVYYLGSEYENVLDYGDTSSSTIIVDKNSLDIIKNSSSTNSSTTKLLSGNDAERIKRLTNSKDHYYSYLYAAIYLKEIMSAWERSGYSISDRPEIVATVYNLGFQKSNPNSDPKVGGAEIDLNGNKYSFGSIAFYFYFSNDLIDIFPR